MSQGKLKGIAQEHRDGHRAYAPGNRRDEGSTLGSGSKLYVSCVRARKRGSVGGEGGNACECCAEIEFSLGSVFGGFAHGVYNQGLRLRS